MSLFIKQHFKSKMSSDSEATITFEDAHSYNNLYSKQIRQNRYAIGFLLFLFILYIIYSEIKFQNILSENERMYQELIQRQSTFNKEVDKFVLMMNTLIKQIKELKYPEGYFRDGEIYFK